MNKKQSVETIQPPCALDVEKAFLSGLIYTPKLIAKYREQVLPSSFYDTRNATIYHTMLDMVDTGREIDLITLSTRLHEIGKMDQCGGDEYLAEIIDNPTIAAKMDEYVLILAEKQVRRSLISKTAELSRQAYDEERPVSDVIEEWEQFESSCRNQLEIIGARKGSKGILIPIGELTEQVRTFKREGIKNTGLIPICRELNHNWKIFAGHYKPSKATFNVWTGIPGHGKSEFVDAIMLNMAFTHKWRWAVFTPENYPHERYVQKLAEKVAGASMFQNMSDNALSIAMENLARMFVLIMPTEDSITIELVKKLSEEAVDKYNVDGVTWDPWNEMELDVRQWEKETDCIGRNLAHLRRFSRRRNICMNIVAHPTKMIKDPKTKKYLVPSLYDISGSSHWYNKADNGFTVYRNFDGEGADKIDVHVQKIKYKAHGHVGVVSFRYQPISGRFLELDDTGDFSDKDSSQTTIW